MKKRIFATAIMSLCAVILFAQQQQKVATNYSDEDNQTFVRANLDITKVQQEAEKEVTKIIEDNGLKVDRFNDIVAIQQGKSDEEASPEELKSFNAAAQKIMTTNQQTQMKMVAKME
ncbi:DUF4168 domain-containing protein [Marivirga sp.]|uniref:DUF4168 domain-containing protein n=1 Tax=Marivirga sp. TaxID=2018662 RepID=UPI002D7F73DE|nr:DUF4168 domain-containing protein [Marivirga sp.]HET8861057.1 DUF4168 domain-containing protein [Marivirga sp.]